MDVHKHSIVHVKPLLFEKLYEGFGLVFVFVFVCLWVFCPLLNKPELAASIFHNEYQESPKFRNIQF